MSFVSLNPRLVRSRELQRPWGRGEICVRREPAMALAYEPEKEGSLYVGTAPKRRPGRLRVDFSERFKDIEVPENNLAFIEVADNYKWSSGGYSPITRKIAVWTFVFRLLSANWIDTQSWSYPLLNRAEDRLKGRRRRLAAWAREQILQLGPTFIKLGQIASTRADILPAEVIEELVLLQDRVPPVSWKAAEHILEEEYGRPVQEIFKYFDKQPLAAASLGQVHRATLFSGEEVVVKIQRPGLKRLFDVDLSAMREVANFLQSSKRYGGNSRDWVGIYEECRRVLYEEIDYQREAESCDRFRINFENAGIQYVKVPRTFFGYTTKRVLCLQYLPGIKITDKETLRKAGLELRLVANRLATAFLMQVLDFAFFTCDPHPGNVAIGADESIIFYDFGMMASLNPQIKNRLIDILFGVVEKNADLVISALVDLDALVLPQDPVPVRRAIQFFLDSVGSRPSREQTVAAIGEDLYATAYDQPFRLPAQSIFLLRALSTLEGLNKSLDPNFKFSEVALPFAGELLGSRYAKSSPESAVLSAVNGLFTGQSAAVADKVRSQVVSVGAKVLRASDRIEKIEKTLSQIEKGDLKIRSRSTETERLLRKQYSLSESSNFLLSSGTTAIAATQLYATGNFEQAIGMALISAVFAIAFLRKSAKLSEDPFKSKDRK